MAKFRKRIDHDPAQLSIFDIISELINKAPSPAAASPGSFNIDLRILAPTFSISATRRAHFNLLRIEEELSTVHLRLARVYVENMLYENLIPRFDKPGTFFYLDPPYYGCENDYGKGIFCREDYGKLRDLLSGIKGKFILSINDVPEIRTLYKGFKVERVNTTYSVPKDKVKKVSELLISNF